MTEFLVLVACIVIGGAIALGIPHDIGFRDGVAEATCWARGTAYIDTTSIGIVCGDGAVVPVLTAPEAAP